MQTELATFRSATCANDILAAWHGHDREQLNRNLDNGVTVDFELNGNSHESERLELLEGIAGQIRASIASDCAQDSIVYLSLLRHLAEPAGVLPDRS